MASEAKVETACSGDGGALRPKKEEFVELMKKLELGLIPDDEIKRLVSIALERRLQWGYKLTHEQQVAQVLDFANSLRQMSIGMEMDALNAHMYELPTSFMKLMLGTTMKASWCYFNDDSKTLDEAEITMMDLYCERAQIEDGQRVLDLGCGYGALTMHVARKYPNSYVMGVTNSISQKEFIEEQCKNYNLSNVEITVADISTHEIDSLFDRIMVIGVLEHMLNYELLFRKISKWMKQDGLLFIDHICHKTFPYHFKPLTEDDWLEKFIIPVGTLIMPSAHFLFHFQDDVLIVKHWILNGKHYSHTNEEWLKRLDANADAAKAILQAFTGNKEGAMKVINHWRILFLFSIELCKYNNGEEWVSSHVLFKKKYLGDATSTC